MRCWRALAHAVAAACSSSRPLHAAASRTTGQPPRLPSSGSIRHEHNCTICQNTTPSILTTDRHTAPTVLARSCCASVSSSLLPRQTWSHRRLRMLPSQDKLTKSPAVHRCGITKTLAAAPQIPIARSAKTKPQRNPILTAISCLGASRTPAAGARRGVRHAGARESCTEALVN